MIRELQPDLNKKVEGRTAEEYRTEKRDEILARNRRYKETHKEERKEVWKRYYQRKREEILEKGRQHRDKNKEKINEQGLRYYYEITKNRKYECLICNCSIFAGTKARHERTQKHQENLKMKQEEVSIL